MSLLRCSLRSENFVVLKYFKLIPPEKPRTSSISLFSVEPSQKSKFGWANLSCGQEEGVHYHSNDLTVAVSEQMTALV